MEKESQVEKFLCLVSIGRRGRQSMIRKYCFGCPFDTEAVVVSMPVSKGEIPHVLIEEKAEETILFYSLQPKQAVFGLGEQVRGMNKRGWIYESNCVDDPEHTEGKHSLYGAHNFLVLEEEKPFGIFIDCASTVRFDIGYTNKEELTITIPKEGFYLYIIEGESYLDITKQFRTLIGRSYIPPKWAFGYQQSRWGYQNEEDILECIRKHKELQIPLDAVYLDIDYMEQYKDFTVDKKRFPDLKKLIEELKREHIHLVPIIDAGVKIEAGYQTYEEGIEAGHFCKKEDGTEFVAGVWPGKVHFPDVLKKEAREWFGNGYKELIELGIDGFWNDMNEPAMFYSEEGLEKVYEKGNSMDKDNLNDFLELQPLVSELANKKEDYERFYHMFHGEKVRHDRVHNLYGFYMTRAAKEAMERFVPEKRMLLFSRSSYIGMHRYGGIWTGDNKSWWSHLLLHIKMMPSLNMCGFLYSGADIGGFGDNVTEDLLLRWLAFAIFVPLMRNHSAFGTRRQEVYQFRSMNEMREIIKLRYRLIPYLYSEYMKCALEDELYFRPLCFDYPLDERAKEVEDQLLLGDGLMIAPVYEQNKGGRYIYLPEDMLMIRFTCGEQYETQVLKKGDHYISVSLEEVVCFLRKDKILLLGQAKQSVPELEDTPLDLIAFVEKQAVYSYYEDDGISTKENGTVTVVTVTKTGEIQSNHRNIREAVVVVKNEN